MTFNVCLGFPLFWVDPEGNQFCRICAATEFKQFVPGVDDNLGQNNLSFIVSQILADGVAFVAMV